jgi:predicted porin
LRIPLSACLVALAPVICKAQSSAAVYGSIDSGVDYVTNIAGSRQWAVNSGRRSPDRFGFRGTEDLGDGLFGFFRIEGGYASDTGTQINPSVFWNRYVLVGIGSKTWGSVYLGHYPDFMYEYLSPLGNAVPGLSSSFNPGQLDFPGVTLDNTLTYESSVINGLQFGVMNGFGESATSFKTNRRYALGARYSYGPLRLGAAYTVINNRVVDIRGLFGLTTFLGQPIAAGTQFTATASRTTGLGGSYAVGLFTPHVLFTHLRFENQNGASSLRNFQGGVNIDASGGSKTDVLGLSYGRYVLQNVKSNQYNLFFSHYFSPTLQVYTGLSQIKTANGVAGFNGYAKSSTGTQSLFRVGIHKLF